MVFICKHVIQSGVTNLCTTEQPAEQVAVSLYMMKLLFCLRVCPTEVSDDA